MSITVIFSILVPLIIWAWLFHQFWKSLPLYSFRVYGVEVKVMKGSTLKITKSEWVDFIGLEILRFTDLGFEHKRVVKALNNITWEYHPMSVSSFTGNTSEVSRNKKFGKVQISQRYALNQTHDGKEARYIITQRLYPKQIFKTRQEVHDMLSMNGIYR